MRAMGQQWSLFVVGVLLGPPLGISLLEDFHEVAAHLIVVVPHCGLAHRSMALEAVRRCNGYRPVMPVVRTHRPDQRPDIEILVDGQWCKGEPRQLRANGNNNGSAQVNWHRRIRVTRIKRVSRQQGSIRREESSVP